MKDIFGLTTDNAGEPVAETIKAPSTSKLRQMFLHYTQNCDEHRSDAFRDRKYYDGDQISEAWRKNLADNETPMVTVNLIKDNIAAHVGLVAAQQTEVRAFARTQAGAASAETATKLIRYAIDSSNFEQKLQEIAPQFFVEGIGALLIECDNENVFVTPIDFRDLIYDPNSRRSDFSDAKWLGFSRWLPANDIAEAYPEAFERISPDRMVADFHDLDIAIGFAKDTDDTTGQNRWLDDNSLLRVVEMYYLEAGQWMNVVWCHKGVLDHGPSQYMDDKGVSLCPILAGACHTMAAPDAKNQRYGQVRDLIGPQNDYNSRRHTGLKYSMSKTIQMVNPNAQAVDAETLRAEAQKRIAIIPDGYQVIDTSISAEQVSFMQIASEEIKRLSPAAAVTGTNLPDDASGRSRQVAAAGGRLSLTPVMNRFDDLRQRGYRHVWYRITQYWHAPMEVRITSDINAPKYMQINAPQVEEVEQPIIDPTTGVPMFDPMTGTIATEMVPQVVGVHNEVAKMDMDFTIKTVEQHNNLEQEVWEGLMQMISSLGVAPGTPEFRAALDWAPIPDKTNVIERYDAQQAKAQQDNAGQAQMQQQMAEMAAQIEMLVKQSKADKDASTAAHNNAKTQQTIIENQMLTDNHNQQQELMDVVKGQMFRQ